MPNIQPAPLTPAQQRVMRGRQTATIRVGQALKQLPSPAPAPLPAGQAPATRLFALEDVRRLPVTQSDAARAFLISSSSEGRIFPQALSEALAGVDGVASIELDVTPVGDHLPAHPTPAAPVLVVTIHPTQYAHLNTRRALLMAQDLTTLHPITHRVLFRAAPMAQHLATLHPQLPLVSITPDVTPVVRPD
jgi:hypothetical protein